MRFSSVSLVDLTLVFFLPTLIGVPQITVISLNGFGISTRLLEFKDEKWTYPRNSKVKVFSTTADKN